MKTFENATGSVNVCSQWRTQGYTDSRDMGPGRGIWTKILYRTGEKGTWHLVLLLKSVIWKLVYYEPLLILFCSLEPVECHLLNCNLTKYIYGIILEETRTTVWESALSFQAGPGDELRPSLPSSLSCSWCPSPQPECVRLFLVCFFPQRQRNSLWAVPGADSPMGMEDDLLSFIMPQNAVSIFIKELYFAAGRAWQVLITAQCDGNCPALPCWHLSQWQHFFHPASNNL